VISWRYLMKTSMIRQKKNIIKETELFSPMNEREIKILAEFSEFQTYEKDEKIFINGEKSDALYIVESGEIIIRKENESGKEIDIARFIKKDYFGELDLLTEKERNATARAEKQSNLLRFPKKGVNFQDFLSHHPSVSAQILHRFSVVIAGRIRKANSLIKENSPVIQELQKQVYQDKLTGLYNKTYLEKRVGDFLQKNPSSLSLLSVKPDNFKVINDNWGHEAGDQTLRIMANEIERIIGPECIPTRYMGNELFIIYPNAGKQEARNLAAEIRNALNNLDLREVTEGQAFTLTASIGVAVYPEYAKERDILIQKTHELPLIGRARGGNKILFPEDKDTDSNG